MLGRARKEGEGKERFLAAILAIEIGASNGKRKTTDNRAIVFLLWAILMTFAIISLELRQLLGILVNILS
jgi:hypothetical protein